MTIESLARSARIRLDSRAPPWGRAAARRAATGSSRTSIPPLRVTGAQPKSYSTSCCSQTVFDERRPTSECVLAPIEVMNLGFPGTNSSHIRNALPKLLSMFHPDVVTVMVGGNDWWTAPEPMADAPGTRARLDTFLWRVSRLYRLLYMLRRSSQ